MGNSNWKESIMVMARIIHDYFGLDWELSINLAPAAISDLERFINKHNATKGTSHD